MNKERLVNHLLELVQIDSESGNEREIADHLFNLFSEMELIGFEDDTKNTTGYGAGNLFFVLKGEEDIEPVNFMVHMDTVAPGNGVKPSIKGNYIVTDGTTILGSDDKAGIAAVVEAIRTIKEQNIPHGDVEVVVTVGEETGLVGAKAFDTSVLNSKFGYAVDGTGKVGTIVNRAPSQNRIEVHIHGKPAHAGIEPEAGVSAINIAAKAISNMKLGRIDAETTANVGRIEGGKSTNIVSDYAYVLLESRSLDEKKLADQTAHIEATFKQAAEELGGKVDVFVEFMYPALHAKEDSDVVKLAVKASENIGREANIISLGGGSDGNVFAGQGIDIAILGLGYEEIHTTEERMPLEELYKITEMIIEIIKLQALK
ncbi:M20/M25/M40 family metallo-hydrolase [Phocicoccus pinnipedialis]|uniref:Peptidase T n=1 Tax=Phocicoccus pinnipedialis TaxID=110845 RepID=A0A6V7RFK6_9BACL|nr:M20/M25/M40 family metallo-hydrolase [Jeotgalicoccus pinnipedialis]MBP1939335.1 tripeptide aminopeptidase [Jeotgalicoccus pinnipedialis]CAD2075814.1 Peptidase T [Jeotgalicoccus pinnipedialis]